MRIVSVYEFQDYKKFLLEWVKLQPNSGRGIYTRIADYLNTSNAALSQIMNGGRNLNSEQAIELAEFIKLNGSETDFFLILVEYDRAGSVKLKKHILEKIKKEQVKQNELIHRVPKDVTLTDDVRAVYYSSWLYTGIRNFIATSERLSLQEVSVRFNIKIEKLRQVMDFLIQHHLIVNQSGKLKVGPQKTHLESTSPWIIKHHQNWRFKSVEKMQNQDPNDLFYSAPMSLSASTAAKIRSQLPEIIKQIVSDVGDSKSEVIRCLNIDWFEY